MNKLGEVFKEAAEARFETRKDMADFFGVTEDTVYNWMYRTKRLSPGFANALKKLEIDAEDILTTVVHGWSDGPEV